MAQARDRILLRARLLTLVEESKPCGRKPVCDSPMQAERFIVGKALDLYEAVMA